MSETNNQQNRYLIRSGMTFVELLAVLVILGLVAGVFTVGIAGKFNQSKRELAKSQIGIIDAQVQAYYTQTSSWPPSDKGLLVLTAPESSPSSAYYLKPNQLTDPWNTPFYIIVPGPDGNPYEIVSYGADGQPGGNDENADLSSLHLRD